MFAAAWVGSNFRQSFFPSFWLVRTHFELRPGGEFFAAGIFFAITNVAPNP
jgi:hypothetical protein